MRIIKLIILCFALAIASSVNALNIYVSPSGNDAWTGFSRELSTSRDADGPLASMLGARNRIREIRKNNYIFRENINVIFAGGTYLINEPILFQSEDSAPDGYVISYEAESGARVVFSGATLVDKFEKTTNGIYLSRLDVSKFPKNDFESLYVNGRKAIRARTPNFGSEFLVNRAFEGDGLDYANTIQRNGFYAHISDFSGLQKSDKNLLSSVSVVVRHAWETSVHTIVDLDFLSGKINLTPRSRYPFKKWRGSQYYFIENFREALDSEGEWFFDKNENNLYYIPREGESVERASFEIPVSNGFLIIRGKSKNDIVENINFRRIHFTMSAHNLGNGGFSGGQAAITLPAAISLEFSRNITFDECDVSNVGAYAFKFGIGVSASKIIHCNIHDLGAGGVAIGLDRPPENGEYSSRGNVISKNKIYNGGNRFEGAVGVWVGYGTDNVISRNEISDFGYTGISLGWKWGYGTRPISNIVENNYIHDIGRGKLSDLGGVYILGPSSGTIVRNNIIHNIRSFDGYARGGWGVYLDEGSSDVRVENNVVFCTQSGGFHQHYGKNNHILGNIFAFSNGSDLERSRIENHVSFVFESNYIISKGSHVFYGKWEDSGVSLKKNYFVVGGPEAYLEVDRLLMSRSLLDEHPGAVFLGSPPLFENTIGGLIKRGLPEIGITIPNYLFENIGPSFEVRDAFFSQLVGCRNF